MRLEKFLQCNFDKSHKPINFTNNYYFRVPFLMATTRSVAIIGGGIGGLTVVNGLMHAGLSVSLNERSPFFIPTAGAGFGLQPNGQAVLAHIGFKEKVQQITHPYLVRQIINDNGDVIASSNRIADYGKRFGFFLGGILRAELVDILKEPIEQAGNLHNNHNVANIKQDADGVMISLENNQQKKSVRVDMLIGADGIHSTVVNQIFPQSPPPIYTKENIFYGVIDNIDQQTSINPTVTAKNTLTHYSQLKRFPKSHPVHECAAATDKKRLLHFGLYYRQHRRDGWHRGRICLLGDSCHATLPYVGQGANMAIEDAVSLATCLEKHHFLIEPASQEYYKQRYDRTRRVVNSARYLGLLLHSQNPVISFIAKRLGPVIIQSNVLMTMIENEFYNKCPISMKPLKEE
ncbi:unnamed protein product [Rotaria socialis]|uniref:FAD-binding domain-containing protein n=3 Tax=Rotaria socialis TaxID=392032 RepID=A0A821B7D2_9BILA|nr:unnamed protein product [Rotaria socialis]CAF4587768.1 unnamed protein product [Rotaria socialis]